ncbi:MAG: hypothetical protein IJ480_02355 [Clostridia bacterium]|nr:hypothetical protein [Clostridia bacterium]
MRQKRIMTVLLAVLCLAVCILSVNLIVLYRNIYRIPEQAVKDLCHILSKEGIYLEEDLVPRSREDGIIYVSDGIGYEENAALLLSGSEIRSTYVIPDGQLFLHYDGDITEFTGGFGFHYRQAGLDAEGRIAENNGEIRTFESLAAGLPELTEDGAAAQAAMAFLDRQDEQLRQSVRIETVIASVRGDDNGRAYVQCLRQIDGVEITENAVICRVENGVVTEAAGKWCFMTFGESYVAQLSDITNILFMMKRTMAEETGLDSCTIVGLERCYSLYFFSQDEGFCLIPCWRVETDTGGVLVYSALDGTLYTKMEEIT